MVIQGYLKVVSRVIQGCFKGFQGYFKGVLKVCPGNFKENWGMIKGCFKHEIIKGVFQQYFRGLRDKCAFTVSVQVYMSSESKNIGILYSLFVNFKYFTVLWLCNCNCQPLNYNYLSQRIK